MVDLRTRTAAVLDLFRLGWGTDRIATYWNIKEPEALRRLNVERSNALRLPCPYEAAK